MRWHTHKHLRFTSTCHFLPGFCPLSCDSIYDTIFCLVITHFICLCAKRLCLHASASIFWLLPMGRLCLCVCACMWTFKLWLLKEMFFSVPFLHVLDGNLYCYGSRFPSLTSLCSFRLCVHWLTGASSFQKPKW
uniref:Uncharacterized protein n=1 Tax=Schistocephalus solidus TaxID=70667 RepID=A0A0X3Q514_SCHSO